MLCWTSERIHYEFWSGGAPSYFRFYIISKDSSVLCYVYSFKSSLVRHSGWNFFYIIVTKEHPPSGKEKRFFLFCHYFLGTFSRPLKQRNDLLAWQMINRVDIVHQWLLSAREGKKKEKKIAGKAPNWTNLVELFPGSPNLSITKPVKNLWSR